MIFVFTHDSIGLGQDGPTHQPIEQLAALRAIPDMTVLRPGDANETAEAWRTILDADAAPRLPGAVAPGACRPWTATQYAPATGVAKGAYVLADAEGGAPQVILIGTGARGAAVRRRPTSGWPPRACAARVVSMPSWELFEAQDPAYRESVLPPAVTARVAVEAGAAAGLGSLCRAAPARSSPCTASAPPRRSRM